MTDAVDLAAALEADRIARGLARIDRAIPTGVPGECEECGEVMPRLVGGRCGFCRDGRRPPLSRFADAPPAERQPSAPTIHPVPTLSEEETAVPTQPDVRNVTIQARGKLRTLIEARAATHGVALGRIAQELVEAGLRAETTSTPLAVEPDGSRAQTIVFLANVPNEWLIEELARRAADGVSSEEHQAAISRAEAAEARLAAAAAALSGSAA